jgi:hypothetical protein
LSRANRFALEFINQSINQSINGPIRASLNSDFFSGDHFEVFATIAVPTTHTDDWDNVWGHTITSSIADTLTILNTCDIKIISAQQSDDQSTLNLSISLARSTIGEKKRATLQHSQNLLSFFF